MPTKAEPYFKAVLGVKAAYLQDRSVEECLNCKMKLCQGCPKDQSKFKGEYMAKKKKSDYQEFWEGYKNWPPGYYCYVCGKPIEEGKLCKFHKVHFGEQWYIEKIQKMEAAK